MNRLIMLLIISAFSLTATTINGGESGKSKIKGEKSAPVQEAPKVKPGNVPRAEITITEGKDTTVKEYRINGVIRAVKVTPKNGLPPYYLIDRNGDGQFVRIGPDMGPEVKVPQWILFEW